MSRSEMIDAFLNGTMSRKDFIRGLAASGVALAAAAAHAAALSSSVHAQVDDLYTPTSKEQCMNGGYKLFGFKNQGQCIRFVNTGKVPDDDEPDQDLANSGRMGGAALLRRAARNAD